MAPVDSRTVKPEIKAVNSLNDLIRAVEKKAVYKKRLTHKNWRLYIYKFDNKYVFRVYEFGKKKTFIKLSIMAEDLRYVQELLDDIKDAFRRYGITFNSI